MIDDAQVEASVVTTNSSVPCVATTNRGMDARSPLVVSLSGNLYHDHKPALNTLSSISCEASQSCDVLVTRVRTAQVL